jgi:hypothetical protein
MIVKELFEIKLIILLVFLKKFAFALNCEHNLSFVFLNTAESAFLFRGCDHPVLRRSQSSNVPKRPKAYSTVLNRP